MSEGLTMNQLAEKNAQLVTENSAMQQQLTNAQEALKSAGIEADTVQAGVMGLVNKLTKETNRANQNAEYLEALTERMLAAEAKLAALEKQEPVAWCNENDLKLMVNKRMIGGMMTVRYHGERPLFTRPAPAIDLNAVRAEGAIAVRNALVVSDDGSDIYAIATEVIDQLRTGNAGKDGSHD